MVRTTIDAMQGNKLIIHQHRSIAGHNLFRFTRARLYGLLVLLVCLLGSIEGLGQQVIGSFTYMDGGFEGQSSGALGTTLSTTAWSRQSQAGASSTIVTSSPRSGSKYASVTSAATVSRNLQSPQSSTASAGPAANTSYVIQYYVRNTSSVNSFQSGITVNGTTNPTYNTAATLTANSAWSLYTQVLVTTNTSVSSCGIGIAGRAAAGTFDIDDFVVYAGNAIDNVAPNSPGSASIDNQSNSSLEVSWGAAAGGVDGGGYVVVRYSISPNADNDPNQNGIYAQGNTLTNGTGSLTGTIVYIGTGTSFTNTGLSSGTQYWYKIYTVDKAFNYSIETQVTGITTSPCTSQTISSFPSADNTRTYGDANYSIPANTNEGLSITYSSSNTAVADISGNTVIIKSAGTTTITATQAGNATYCSATATQTLTINKKDLFVEGVSAENKTFNGTIAATLSGTATLNGVLPTDVGNVNLGGTPSATFADASVGNDKPVTVTGYTISGSAASNYNLIQPTGLKANITPAANSIDLSPATQAKGPFCNGSANSIALTYTTSGTVTAPLFIQLSNSSGTFISGTTDLGGTVTGSGPYTITASIPAGTTAGNNYRVRILSSDATPVSSTNNASDIVITAAVTPSVTIAISPSNTICSGTSVTFTPTPTNGGTPTYTWWKNGIGTGTSLGTGATLTTSTLANGDVVAAVMTSTISCVSSTSANSNNIMMTVTTPTPPGSISGSATVCQGQNSVGYSVTNAGGHTYNWSYTGSGYSGSSGTNNITGNYSTSASSGNITVTSTLSGCTSSASSLAITVNPLPAQPGAYTSSTSTVYFGQTGVGYTIPAVAGATGYSWSYSGTGATINGSGTSVTVDFSTSATSGTLSVFAVNACGNSLSARTIAIAVAPINDLCANATGLIVATSAVGGTMINSTTTTPFAKKDVWYNFTPPCSGPHSIIVTGFSGDIDVELFGSPCPTSTSFLANSNTTSSTETISQSLMGGATYYVRVLAFNTAAESSTFTVQVTGTTTVPAIPGTITQPAAPICASSTGKTFSIASVSGATSYTWSATGTGWSVTAGGTTTSATVTIGTAAGTVSVTANNGCGSSAAQTTGSISPIALPADPSGSITPAANPACTNTSLSYSAPAASIYWQTTSTGTNTASVTTSPFSISGSGTYYVRAYNGNCWSTNSTASAAISISTQAAISMQPINKSVTSPTGTSFSVIATNATSYQWQEDAGSGWTNITNGGIYSGATTSTLTLSATAENMDGNGYRVLVGAASPCTTVTSNAVSLAVAPGPCLSESFESGLPTSYGATTSFSLSSGTWTGQANGVIRGTSGVKDGSYSLQLRNQTGAQVTSPSINTGNLIVSFWAEGSVTPATVQLNYSTDNGATWIPATGSPFSLSTTSAQYTSTINSSASSLLIQFYRTAATVSIDKVEVTCLAVTCTSASVTSFLPASGPVGTWVTITGTGFTGATDVKFGGVSASSFTLVNSTTIKAKVPTAAINGNISVTVGGCAAASSSSFTLISQTSCSSSGGTATDLFISEVYDAVSGSLGYIEIFNGTGSTVTLTNYTIRIRTGTSTDNDFPMSGTLASGAVYILRVGTSSSGNCSGFTIHDNQSSASGFNGNDQIFLLKNGSVIDYAPNPNATGAGGSNANAPGFSQVRKNTVTAPSTTYISSQWTNSSVESCSDLGVAPYVPGGNSVTVTGPSDYTLCTVPISFSATVNGTGPNSPTYLWKVYNPLTNAWVDASTLSTVSGFGLYSSISTSATNTVAMSVTGNVAQLQNYQFYLQVTRGSCIAASAAAQYLYETRPYYRSNVASGNWSAPGSWQMSNDKATWVSACSYPIALNSDEVEIQTGHVIALDLDADIDKVTINASTGQLTINNTSKLTILNGNTGADLIVNGILQDDGSTANGIDYATNASWTLGSAGKIIKTNGGSSKYRDNYETGIANIPATASWIYRIATASPTLFVVSGSSSTTMYYPHLTIENTTVGNFSSSITASPDLSQFAFIGSNNGVIVKGDLNVGGSLANAGTVSFSNINSYAPLQVLGNTTIISGNTLNNTGNASAAGGGFEFQGNLVNNGTLRSKLYAANGTSGKLWFTGGNNQTISGSGVFDLHNFRVNKTGSSTLTLTTDVLVPDSLTLVNGIVYTNASPSGLLTLGTTTNVVYGSPGTAAYINGPLAKQFAVGANTEFLYPLGKPLGYPTAYNPCYVVPTNITGATTTFTSEYFAGPNEAQGVMGGSVLGITNKEYWNINKSPSNTSTARVKLYYDNPGSANWIYYTGASVSPFYTNAVPPCWYCNVAVVHKEATTWNFTKTSNFSATDPEYKYYATDGWIYSKAIDNFSPFTLAYSYNMILPVKLLAFTGRLMNADGMLEWSIADARDLDGFELEYSTDGSSYQSLAKIGSNGSTRYSFLHKKLPAGTNYYRLQVKEKGGNQYYSQVVMLNMGKLKTYVIGLAPTVVGTQLTTAIFAANVQKLQARITDVLGRQLWTGSKNLAAGTNQWNIDTHDLPKGLYFISLETPDGLKETLRFIKE